jgi:hypothetical protein
MRRHRGLRPPLAARRTGVLLAGGDSLLTTR